MTLATVLFRLTGQFSLWPYERSCRCVYSCACWTGKRQVPTGTSQTNCK
jgi:hypothetical protein